MYLSWLNMSDFFFFNESYEIREQVAQRCSIPGNIQGPGGWGSEQPHKIGDVSVHCRLVGLDNF